MHYFIITNGWSLYIKDRLPVYCYNLVGKCIYTRSTKEVPTGVKASISVHIMIALRIIAFILQASLQPASILRRFIIVAG
jgi:hypothetical protein